MKDIFLKAIDSGEKTAGVETQYKVSTDATTVYLAIQGSIQKEDWLANFDFVAIPYRKMPVVWFCHRGFIKTWKAAREQIIADVLPLLPGKRLVILGYSHGAAIATLAHEDFIFLGYDPETWVFGSPRVLWMPVKLIKDRFSKLHNIQNRGDIVTMVPFGAMGFCHVGEVVHVGPNHAPWYTPHLIPQYLSSLS